jgi:hypothetical protein
MRRFAALTSRRLALGLALLITATVSAQNPGPSPAVPAVNETDPGKQQDSQQRPTRQTGQERDKNALRDALVALTRGDTQKSISILEPVLVRRSGHDASVAALRAYLGVAYATQALSSPKQDEPARLLREKALAQFRLAVAAQPDYRLSSRLVSPRIVALFQQARTNP